MDKLTEMTVFVEVARLGSFSAAARRLRLSPSAVSKLITRMEARLDSRLLNRTTRKLSLTEGGQAFLERCRVILEQVEEAEEQLGGYYREPKGRLTLSASPGLARHRLIPLIRDFLAEYPGMEVDLQLTGKTVDIVSENIDIAIRLGSLKDSSLITRKLGESRKIICASPDYLQNHGTPKTPDDLKRHNCLTISTSKAFNQWQFSTPKEKSVMSVSGNFVTDTVDSLHELALIGGGIARLSEFMVGEDLAAGRLVSLLEKYNREIQTIHAVYAHRHHLPAKMRLFIDFMVARSGLFSTP